MLKTCFDVANIIVSYKIFEKPLDFTTTRRNIPFGFIIICYRQIYHSAKVRPCINYDLLGNGASFHRLTSLNRTKILTSAFKFSAKYSQFFFCARYSHIVKF